MLLISHQCLVVDLKHDFFGICCLLLTLSGIVPVAFAMFYLILTLKTGRMRGLLIATLTSLLNLFPDLLSLQLNPFLEQLFLIKLGIPSFLLFKLIHRINPLVLLPLLVSLLLVLYLLFQSLYPLLDDTSLPFLVSYRIIRSVLD